MSYFGLKETLHCFPGGTIASINCDNSNKQIEIPNNFSIELKTPSGFVITIKSSDLKDNK